MMSHPWPYSIKLFNFLYDDVLFNSPHIIMRPIDNVNGKCFHSFLSSKESKKSLDLKVLGLFDKLLFSSTIDTIIV